MTVSMVIGVFVKIFFLLTPFFVLSVYVTLTRGEEHMTRRKLAVRTTVAVLVIVMILYLFGEAIFRYLGITLDAFRIGSGIVLLLSGIEVVRGTGIPAGRQSNDDGDIAVVPFLQKEAMRFMTEDFNEDGFLEQGPLYGLHELVLRLEK